jgi:hypothetical protein
LSRVLRDALVAPGDVRVELTPLRLRALDHQARQRVHLMAGVLEHARQHPLQYFGPLCKHQPELRQQPANAVDARGALGLQAFAQSVHAQHALLLHRLHRHEAHRRPTSSLADGRRIVGVVLAGAALAAVRLDQLRRHQPRLQPQSLQPPRPMVSARADLHRHHAARGQASTPRQELLAQQRASAHHLACAVHRMHLNDSFGQVSSDSNNRATLDFRGRPRSCNLLHGLPLSIASD